jgi:hypothetical protein
MATLQGTSLIDCLYIPDFIASATKTVFENATAPTSWTKDSTYNNTTLRVINGSITTGGSTAFTTILTSRPVQGTVSSVQSGVTIGPIQPPLSIGPAIVSGTLQSTAATTPPHTHQYFTSTDDVAKAAGAVASRNRVAASPLAPSNVGSGGGHTHSFGPYNHSHPFPAPSIPAHTHTITETSHDHPVSSTAQDFAVYYRDVILATKD